VYLMDDEGFTKRRKKRKTKAGNLSEKKRGEWKKEREVRSGGRRWRRRLGKKRLKRKRGHRSKNGGGKRMIPDFVGE